MIKDISTTSLKFKNDQLFILNQYKLPHEEEWISVKDAQHMDEIIKNLSVRGAPLIGVSAVLCLAMEALKGNNPEGLLQSAKLLRKSRPTAVNLMLCIDRMSPYLDDIKNFNREEFINEAFNIYQEDVELCLKMAKHGASLINDGDNILTHCNTGALATAGIGTALGVIRYAFEQKKKIHVYVDETRPLLQGARLTCYELEKLNIPYTLISDNMAAHLMGEGKIQKVFLGADRIALNGDFANKIGTQSVAILAKYYNIPFYTVAPYTTIDPACESGSQIPIEQRKEDEVRGVGGHFGKVIWSPKNSNTYNPAFDVTPCKLVTGIVLDTGIFYKEQIINGGLKEASLKKEN